MSNFTKAQLAPGHQLNINLDFPFNLSAQPGFSGQLSEVGRDSSAKTFIVCPAKGLTSPAKMERVGATCFSRGQTAPSGGESAQFILGRLFNAPHPGKGRRLAVGALLSLSKTNYAREENISVKRCLTSLLTRKDYLSSCMLINRLQERTMK